MNKLFVYGCSYTYGNGCLPVDPYNIQYKQTEDDLIWPELIAKKLNLELFNYGMGAYSNDKILDSMMSTYNQVGEGDYVIIQKTFTHRFDIMYKRQKNEPYAKNSLTITPNSEEALQFQGYDAREIESILYAMWLMDSEVNDIRVDNRLNFFRELFLAKKAKRCVVWDVINYIDKSIYERIQEATDGKIVDAHWSYKGHKTFADQMYNMLYKFI